MSKIKPLLTQDITKFFLEVIKLLEDLEKIEKKLNKYGIEISTRINYFDHPLFKKS